MPYKSCKDMDNTSQGIIASEFGANNVVVGGSGFRGYTKSIG